MTLNRRLDHTAPGMPPVTEVLLRVPDGRIHRATKVGNAYRVGENCNLDDSHEEYELGPDELANAEDGDLCRNASCFPDVGEPDDAA